MRLGIYHFCSRLRACLLRIYHCQFSWVQRAIKIWISLSRHIAPEERERRDVTWEATTNWCIEKLDPYAVFTSPLKFECACGEKKNGVCKNVDSCACADEWFTVNYAWRFFTRFIAVLIELTKGFFLIINTVCFSWTLVIFNIKILSNYNLVLFFGK